MTSDWHWLLLVLAFVVGLVALVGLGARMGAW